MTGRSNLSMVVADDDSDICNLLQMKFESLGFKVFTVSDGGQVLALIQRTRPSIVILDIVMPVLSGMEILSQLRATPGIAATPVILMTSDHRERDAARGLLPDIVAFMVKPFRLKDLSAVVHAALDNP